MTRRVLPVLLVLLLWALLPGTASAHAELVRSAPAADAVLADAPARVRLEFSEPIEPDFFALDVYAGDGTRVDRGVARVPSDSIAALETDLAPLPQGTYTVAWRVMSVDSHIVQGTFAFSVGAPSASSTMLDVAARDVPFALDVMVRWATFVLSFLLVGGLAFVPLVLWPALHAAGVADGTTSRRAERTTIWLVWIALVMLLAISLLALLVQAAHASGTALGDVWNGRAVSRLLFGTKYGALWLGRLGCLVGLLAILAWASVRMRLGYVQAWSGIVVGANMLLLLAASGHASAVVRGTALVVAADWVHLVAGAIWTGGLVQLVLVVPLLRPLTDADGRQALARIVRRFSWTAGLSVAALLGTGVYAGLVHVPTLRSLGYTDYGAALSGKVLLVVGVLALGAFNLLVMHPRFVRLAAGKGRTEGNLRRPFRWIVGAELVTVALVLLVTGVLTGLPPATTSPGTGLPYAATQGVGDLRVTLRTTPNQAGDNQIEATLTDRSGAPVELPQLMLTLEHLDMAMDERHVVLEPVEAGRYHAEGNALNMAGRWRGTMQVGSGVTSAFQWTVGDPPGRAPAFSPALIVLNAATPLAGVGLTAWALAALVLGKRSGWKRERDRRQAVWIGGALLLLGTLATGNVLATAYHRTLPNPVPATAENIAQGRQLYVQNCASCHGVTGRGDGPAGGRLNPRPADFWVHMREGHPDPQLYSWITEGVDGTGMPAFGDTLSEDEIWTVINFLHTFGPPQP